MWEYVSRILNFIILINTSEMRFSSSYNLAHVAVCICNIIKWFISSEPRSLVIEPPFPLIISFRYIYLYRPILCICSYRWAIIAINALLIQNIIIFLQITGHLLGYWQFDALVCNFYPLDENIFEWLTWASILIGSINNKPSYWILKITNA